MKKKENPLLNKFETLFQTIPFDYIKAEHFEPAFKIKIKEAKKQLNKLTHNSETPTFKNTLLPIELKYDEISRLSLILFNLNSAETNAKIQAVTQKVSPLLTKFMSKVMLQKKLYKRVEYIYKNRTNETLSVEELRLVETTFKTMKRNGANLSFYKKIKLIRVQMRLAKLTLKFNENVLAETNNFELHLSNANELSGLPENERETAKQTAKAKGKKGWIFTLQYPSYGPFLKYANNRALREIIYKAFTSRANRGNKNDNKALISKILNLRLKQTLLLGYKTYAQYVLEERMAQTSQSVNAFLGKLHVASKSFAKIELNELSIFAQQQGFRSDIMPWDLPFYSEKLKTEKYGFNEEMVKPFFQLDNVIKGIFDLSTKLYGITFKEVNQIQVYHPDVKTYEVYDLNDEFLSILYADFHPRENKQGGAWMTEYRSQSNINGQMQRPHISICCNFTKPTDKKPSLLTFSEVNTFLHEFGHAIHGMFANTTYPSLSGTNVYRDFVELPSQIMENWLTEMEWLEQFAIHYETGDPISKELVQKLIDARNFQAGFQSERQLTFGMLDMEWHTITKKFTSDIISFEKEKIAETSLLPYVEGSCISTSFSHIFAGGYAAGYYGYKWAEVLDADAFSLFKREGIFNKRIAEKFRHDILEKGGTDHPMELYLNFRGKEPSSDALLERSGLK